MWDGIQWITVNVPSSSGVPKQLPEIINNSEVILPYLDVPFQHISDEVLKGMGRPWKGDRIRRLIETLRKQIPGLVLRTTLDGGFSL